MVGGLGKETEAAVGHHRSDTILWESGKVFRVLINPNTRVLDI